MKPPTHIRLTKKSAKQWGYTVNDIIPIETLEPMNKKLSTISFAWVDFSEVAEFLIAPYIKCKKCKRGIVINKEDICEECYNYSDSF